MAKQTLMEDIQDEISRKRTIDCLDYGMQFIDELRRTHKISPSSADATLQPTAKSVARVHGQRVNRDWQIVDAYREEKGKDMDWNKWLFKNYTKMDSAKAAYFRTKK
ncbi:hypothetical protein DFQ28_002765 [Apophysomyces sp. BC1034]|nr:hypothetical protein DFQ29_003374 [Apophysomyces sp. BC1021]KAG0193890.1 hypothetical protein DFQ28_002765 [Apophysomyces sp. BC1034]